MPNLSPDHAPSALPGASGSPVLGLDNVRLELTFAGLGSRGLAAAVDYFLLGVFQLLWFVGGLTFFSWWLETSAGWLFALLTFGSFFIQWGFFAGFEIATDGRTPGKQLLGLRVVSEQGGQASMMAILIRNLLRTFDVLIGVPIMMFDSRARRLGDLVAGTAVIHQTLDLDRKIELGRLPEGWGAEEIALTESFLRRAEHLEPDLAQSLAADLLRFIERQHPGFLPDAERPAGESYDRLDLLRRALAVS